MLGPFVKYRRDGVVQTDKLTTVVDIYLNNHSSSPRGYATAYKGAQASMGSGAAKIPAASKTGGGAYAYTVPQAKPVPLLQTPTNNSAPLRWFRCLQYGHRAAICKTNPSNFSRKPEKSEGPIPHKAKVNHVSAVETRPNAAIPLNGYKPVIQIPELRIPPPEFYEELQRRSDAERAEFMRSRCSEFEMQAQPTFDDNLM